MSARGCAIIVALLLGLALAMASCAGLFAMLYLGSASPPDRASHQVPPSAVVASVVGQALGEGADPAQRLDPGVERFQRRFVEKVALIADACVSGSHRVACEGDLCVIVGRSPGAIEAVSTYLKRPEMLIEQAASRFGLPFMQPCAEMRRSIFGFEFTILRSEGNWLCTLHAKDPAWLHSEDAATRGTEICGLISGEMGGPW